MSEQAWPDVSLKELFTINTNGVTPYTEPNTIFHHHSLPAWDVSGGPSVEKGSSIESNKTRITKPCVLVSKLNPRKPRVSVVEAVPEEERHCASTEFVCLEPESEEPLNFWGHLFLNKSFSENLDRIAIGSTNSHKRFSPKALLSQRIELPPVTERKLIARILDTLDTQIHKTEALIAKLEKVKEGLLHDLLTRGIDDNGQLRPSPEQAPELYKESPLGLIPREWAILSISEICSHIVDCPHSTPVYRDSGVLVARTTHIKNGEFLQKSASRVSELEYQQRIARLRPEAGDIVFTREAPVGEAFVIPKNMRLCLGQRVMLIRFKNTSSTPKYVLSHIYSGRLREKIQSLTAGTTNPHLNVSEVGNFLIPIPPTQEQQKINSATCILSRQISEEKKNVNKLVDQKAGLMDDLLTGRVRVTPLLEKAQETTPA